MVESITSHKILVTGGTGYLGGRIGKSLAAQGFKVSLGSRNPFSKGSVPGCDQIVTDWADPELDFCKGFGIIIHAAGINAEECGRDPFLAHYFNGDLTRKIIEKSAIYGCEHFFYLSTVHVYDSPLTGRFTESSAAANQHPYATSHFAGEQALLDAISNGIIRGSVLRLSNCFGSPVTDSYDCWKLAANQFIRQAVETGRLTIKGDYLAKRDFLPISELCNIISTIVTSDRVLPNVINVSAGVSRTLYDVADTVSQLTRKLTGRSVSIETNPNAFGTGELLIDNSRLKSLGISIDSDIMSEISDSILFVAESF